MNLRQLLADSIPRLRHAGVESPQVDARELLSFVSGIPTERLILHSDEELNAAKCARFEELISRRSQREPLQHILGTAPFGPLTLRVGKGVFIPRPETEVLAEWAVQQLRKKNSQEPVKVVELCAGSGAISAYIAHYVPECEVVSVELSPQACQWARLNLPDRVRLIEADATETGWIESYCPQWRGEVDLVVTNPPYVPERSYEEVSMEAQQDPPEAVFSGEDGMSFIRRLPDIATQLLKPRGQLGFEHDDSTAGECFTLFDADSRWEGTTQIKDLAGRYRFVITSKL